MRTNQGLVFSCIEGRGLTPTICLPGFVPRAQEAFHKQIGLFRNFGDVWLVDYPDHGFDLQKVLGQLSEIAERVGRQGAPPVIVSVSFGSALVMQLLRRSLRLPIGGCIFISPMVALRDIYLNDEDATFFGRLAGSIIHGREFSPDRIVRARKVFRRLLQAGHSRGAANLTQPVIDEIYQSLLQVKDAAVFERLKAISEIEDLCGNSTITTAPTLILWAEEEQHVIRTQSRNFQLLSQQPGNIFPAGRSMVLRSGHPNRRLKHASLLAHSALYNSCFKKFYLQFFLSPGKRLIPNKQLEERFPSKEDDCAGNN